MARTLPTNLTRFSCCRAIFDWIVSTSDSASRLLPTFSSLMQTSRPVAWSRQYVSPLPVSLLTIWKLPMKAFKPASSSTFELVSPINYVPSITVCRPVRTVPTRRDALRYELFPMFEKWLLDETATLQRIRIVCCGDYKAGKSDFLRRYTSDPSSQDNEDAGEAFVKLLVEPPLKVGVELYELPSSANLDHQSCYTSVNYDAVVYFFEASNQKLGEHLAVWLRHYFRDDA